MTAMICLVDEEVFGLVESIEGFCSCVLWDFCNSVVFFLLSFSKDFTGKKAQLTGEKCRVPGSGHNLQDGASKIAFYGRYNYSIHGVYKPTNITGGHHLVGYTRLTNWTGCLMANS